MKKNVNTIDFEEITLRLEISHRGGGVEISLDTLGFEGGRMSAYQNYLGGGLLGRVCSDCNIKNWSNNKKLVKISDDLKRYYHSLTNPSDGWESIDYLKNQNMPVSGY